MRISLRFATITLLVAAVACLQVNGPAAAECRNGQALVVQGGAWTCADLVVPPRTGPGGAAMVDSKGVLPASAIPEVGLPVGSVLALAGDQVPEGWVLCDGRTYDRFDPLFVRLFAVIGTSYGSPDGSPEKFNVPDYRGRFLRGSDSGSGRDPDADKRGRPAPSGNPGPLVGSIQWPAVGRHQHRIPTSRAPGRSLMGSLDNAYPGNGQGASDEFYSASPIWTGANLSNPASNASEATSFDTRPENAAVIWIIKR